MVLVHGGAASTYRGVTYLIHIDSTIPQRCVFSKTNVSSGSLLRTNIVTMGHLHDDIIYYYDQNPSGFCFPVQIAAFVIYTSMGLPNLNMKRKAKRILVVVIK